MSEWVAVLGGGSFGTVLANIIANNGHHVHLWVRERALADEINHTHCNSKYFDNLSLHVGVVAETDLGAVLSGAGTVLVCVPSSAYRSTAKAMATHLSDKASVISTAKGLEPDCFKLMSEILSEELSPKVSIGVLSGPNIAAELARAEITATVLASTDKHLVERVHAFLYCSYLRVYSSTDIQGVELAGALKNIYAIIAGIASSMGVGYNSIALLITRALAEMRRFAVNSGARAETVLGLAGNGDLIVTCLSPDSRNYRFGQALGQGRKPKEAIAEIGRTVEGINTLKVVHAEARRRKLYMPLLESLYQMLHEDVGVSALLEGLMHSEQRADVEIM